MLGLSEKIKHFIFFPCKLSQKSYLNKFHDSKKMWNMSLMKPYYKKLFNNTIDKTKITKKY